MVRSTETQTNGGTLLTAEQLADRWGMSPGTLSNWRSQSRGPAYVRLGGGAKGPVRYRLQDVLEYESEHYVQTRRR